MSEAGETRLGRSLSVLRALGSSGEGASFTDIKSATGLPKATLHRLMRSLMAERLVRLDEDDRRYRLGGALLELARQAWEQLDVRRAAAGILSELTQEAGETVHLAILDRGEVVYVDKVESSQTIRMASGIGHRNPAYCTGVGKAMLAFLDEGEREAAIAGFTFHRFTERTLATPESLRDDLRRIRQRGYAFDDEEHEEGIRCVASPIFGNRNTPIASVSVTAPRFRCDDARLEQLAALVVEAAGKITFNCGGRPGTVAPGKEGSRRAP